MRTKKEITNNLKTGYIKNIGDKDRQSKSEESQGLVLPPLVQISSHNEILHSQRLKSDINFTLTPINQRNKYQFQSLYSRFDDDFSKSKLKQQSKKELNLKSSLKKE
ncbi:hypothetical protein HK096_005080, partial [Nowakowskiella sp. JEL0078]